MKRLTVLISGTEQGLRQVNVFCAYFACLVLFSSVLFSSLSLAQCPTNSDFEDGTTNNWVCKSGSYGTGACPTPQPGQCPTFGTVLGTIGCINNNGNNAPLSTLLDRHTIMTGAAYGGTGIDPNSIAPFLIPAVDPSTTGGTYSFRLGDGIAGGVGPNCPGPPPNCYARAEAMRLTFMVNTNNALFTYRYAVFIQDPGHWPEEQPRFEVLVTQPDSNDQLIPCGYYKVVAGSFNPSCPGTTGFLTGVGTWKYKDWTDVGLDLTNYIGQNIAIEFRTSDCFPGNGTPFVSCTGNCCTTTLNGVTCRDSVNCAGPPPWCTGIPACTNQAGSHSCYAYIDTYCQPANLQTSAYCGGGASIWIYAPKGYTTYSWVDFPTVITDSVLVTTPVPGTSYVVNMTSVTNCPASATITIGGADIVVLDTSICEGTTGTVPLYVNPLFVTGTPDYLWAGPGGFSSTLQNPSVPIPPVPGIYTYTITVTDTGAAHCSATKTENILIDAKPQAVTSPNSSVCIGTTVVISSSGGGSYNWSTGDTSASITKTPLITDTYFLTITNAQGCQDTGSVTITVNPLPPVSLNTPTAICQGTSTQLSTVPVANATYTWSHSGAGLINGGGNSVTITPIGVETYTVVVTDAFGCQSSGSVSVTANSVAAPAPSSPATICLGSNTLVTAAGVNQCVWSSNDPTFSPPPNSCSSLAAPASASTFNYFVTITDGNGCTSSGSTSVTVNALPVVNATSPAICSGANAQLAATTGFRSYSWIPSAPLSIANPLDSSTSVINPPVGTYTLTVVVTDASGCANYNTTSLTVNSLPTVAAASPPVCSGTNAQLNATPGFSSYSWIPSAPLSITNPFDSSTTVVNPPAGTYALSVVVTDAQGCANYNTTSLTVNPLPFATAISPPVCIGTNAQLNATAGFTSYSWIPSAPLSITNPLDSSTTVVNPPAGTYTLTVVVTDGKGCSNYSTTSLTVNQLPVVIASSPPVCAGTNAQLNATAGFTYYSWVPSTPLTISNDTSFATPVITPPVGSYTFSVMVTDSNGCSNYSTTALTVNPLPVPSISPPTSVCSGTPVLLTASGGGNYLWSSGATTAATTVTPMTTTNYNVTVTNPTTGCYNTASTTVNVNLNLVVPPIPNRAICIGQSTTLDGTTPNGAFYSWSPGGPATSTWTLSPTNTQTYTLDVSSASGCTGSNTVTVTVNPLPPVSVSLPTVICLGKSSTLTAGTGISCAWTSTDPAFHPPVGSCNTAATPTAVGNYTYNVIVTDVNGCTNSTSTSVAVNPKPNITASPDVTICRDSITLLSAAGAGLGGNYSWSPGGLYSSSYDTMTVRPPQTQTYVVTGTDLNGCSGSKNVRVNVVPPPYVTLTPQDICVGESVQLQANSNALYYTWAPDPSFTTSLNIPNPTVRPKGTTTYSVTVSNGGNCPPVSDDVTVTVHPIPFIVAGTDTTIMAGDTATLTVSGGGAFYQWVPSSDISCSTCQTTFVAPLATTTYIVTTTDIYGCRNSDTVLVVVDDVLTLYVPNAFTPDDHVDNNNIFYAYGVGIWKFEFYIFDRWGTQVFESFDPYVGWNGTFRGKKVQQDVYVYLAKARSITGKSISKTGTVTVVR